MTEIEQQELFADPRRWSVLRRAKAMRAFGASLVLLAGVLFVPAAWIVLMPSDTTLRPDLTHTPAVLALILCPLLVYTGRRITTAVWNRYGTSLYTCANHVRQAGARAGFAFDIELPQLFPRVMFARKDRMMGVALPFPLMIHIDDIDTLTVVDDIFIRLTLKDPQRHAINIVAGDGTSKQSGDETRYLADRMREFAFLPQNTRTPEDEARDELMRGFLSSPKL